jgi:hypothetical protein
MPVLVIKHHIEDFAVNDVWYASTFTEADNAKFEAFLPFLRLFDPRIHLLKVNTPKNFERSEDSTRAMDVFLQRHELGKLHRHHLQRPQHRGGHPELLAWHRHGPHRHGHARSYGLLPCREREPDGGHRQPHLVPGAQCEALSTPGM